MKYLAFKLSMPSRGSWNGKWSGENDLFCRVVRVSEVTWEKRKDFYEELPEKYLSYNFGDGWVAQVDVEIVDKKTAKTYKKKSKGFYCYDWMIKSILEEGKIVVEYSKQPLLLDFL